MFTTDRGNGNWLNAVGHIAAARNGMSRICVEVKHRRLKQEVANPRQRRTPEQVSNLRLRVGLCPPNGSGQSPEACIVVAMTAHDRCRRFSTGTMHQAAGVTSTAVPNRTSLTLGDRARHNRPLLPARNGAEA